MELRRFAKTKVANVGKVAKGGNLATLAMLPNI
jgi:hypothetical protein